MLFEYNLYKSASNKEKHGIDFEEAKALWSDPDLIEIPANTSDEPQFLVVGKIADKYWSAVITYRANRIRIISARRARVEEIKYYEKEN